MKRYILLLLVAIGFVASNAQVPDMFYIQKSEGAFSSFFYSEVKSIQYSKTDLTCQPHEKYVTQIIETSDSLYRLPLKEVLFEAPADPPIENGITPGIMVDLGLSVKWASHNIGATSPEEYGGLYGWADPIGTNRSTNNADYPNATPPTNIAGTEYDIATAKWGKNWRMPTVEEYQELVDKCTWTWITYKFVNGMKVTGPNGNSIFLPAMGYRLGITCSDQDNMGCYWCSTPYAQDTNYAFSTCFRLGFKSVGNSYRSVGNSVRPVDIPSARYKANTTIAAIKEKYWQDAVNYIDTIKVADGAEPVVIKGRVISSDATSNIYKNLVIQDETGALAVAINAKSLYTTYPIGQEIVINLSNMYIGKYAGLQQLGAPDFKDGFGWQATFMSLAFFEEHSELNDLPDIANIDTITTYKNQPLTIGALPTMPAEIRGMQSQLVRFDDVEFEGGGILAYSEPNASTSRILKDSNGNLIDVRNSNYATFKNEILPKGKGSVVGILSMFNAKWQLLLRSTDDCIGFGKVVEGSKESPYTIARAIALQGTSTKGWMTGYIVGAVAPDVIAVKSNSDIQWKAGTDLENTIVIGATPETKDIKNCIVMSLPQGSPMRTALNLTTNPNVYQKGVKVSGVFESYMGTYGLIDNYGSPSEFIIDTPIPGGDGDEDNPFTVAQLIGGTASGTEKWVTGYIVGWIEGQDPKSGAKFTIPSTVVSNILIATSSDVTDITQCVPIQLVYDTDPRLLLNLMDHPENLGAQVSIKGNIEEYFKMAGLKNTTACKLGDNPNPPVNPPISSDLRADFETFNGGVASGFYETSTSTNGWTIIKCSLLMGGATDANPIFRFIGKVPGSDAWAMAPSMNGKVGAGSSIKSPIISTGCGSLTFNYGMAFTEINGIDFRVEIKQNGAIVKTITIKDPAAAKVTQYTHTEAVNITGNFTMEFYSNSPSNVTDGSKDRVCIYNVSWTEKK